jgi:capsular exopolysaccharide synthesis family protein
MILGALLTGCVFGIVLAFAVEAFDATYRSAEQVEADMRLTVLAHLPKVPTWKLRGEPLVDTVLTRPNSAYAECVRSLCARLLLSAPQGTLKTVLFVSAQAGEGKTTTALAFARMEAAAGRRVIIVDADSRRSRISKLLQLTKSFGLTDLLMASDALDETQLREAIQTDSKSGANIINAGSYSVGGAQLFGSTKFEVLLGLLEREYDLIIIDSPPVSALSDALVLSRKADATVVVVAWGTTRRRALKYTVQQLTGYANNIAGVVLSKVDVKQQARYSYGDSIYYTGSAKAYYQNA